MSEIVKIQKHRNSNFIKSELITDENKYLGITGIWYEVDKIRTEENIPTIGEICNLKIEGNYEINLTHNLWIQFETWDSKENGISNLNHIDTNRLLYGQIVKIERKKKAYIDCQFQVIKSLSLNDIQRSDHIEMKWKDVIVGFAKIDFTGSLLTVIKFDNYYSAICQTDGGPFYSFVFEISGNIQLKHITECDKYEDPLITYTNQSIDEELENILVNESQRRIKAFRYKEKGFNEFLCYVDETKINMVKSELLNGNKLTLRKGWKKEILEDKLEIDLILAKMNDYY